MWVNLENTDLLSRHPLSNETHEIKALKVFEHNHLLLGTQKMVTFAIQPYKKDGKSSYCVKSLRKCPPNHRLSTIFFFLNNVHMPSPQLCSPLSLENSILSCWSLYHRRIKALPPYINKLRLWLLGGSSRKLKNH